MDDDYTEKHFLIIGAGNIGYRHFEGIIKSSLDLRISVVDPDPSRYERFQSAIKNTAREDVEINFYTNLDFKSSFISVAFITTNANVRRKVLEDLYAKHNVQAVILEKLISNSAQDLDAIEAAIINQDVAWVNYPRRIMAFYRNISENLVSKSNLDVKVEGVKWNLISNAPHFIDLVEFLTNSELSNISQMEVNNKMYETRPGFMDATGKMAFHFSDQSRLELVSREEDTDVNSGVSILIKATNLVMEINEQKGHASGTLLKKEVFGKIEFQSDLSNGVVDSIVLNGCSDLTSFKEAARSHRLFVTAVENYLRVNRIYDLYHNRIT